MRSSSVPFIVSITTSEITKSVGRDSTAPMTGPCLEADLAFEMNAQLPGVDALKLTRRIKTDPARRDIVVLAHTAHAMKGDDERARAAGADAAWSNRLILARSPT